jgi:hypothetical protein
LACKIQTPGNYPEESIHHSEHGESLKSRIGMKNWEQRKPVGYLTFTYHAFEPE